MLAQTLDGLIEAKRSKDFDELLRDDGTKKILGANLAYFAHWASEKIASQYPPPSDSIISSLLEYLMSMSTLFDIDETFIVVTGLVRTLRGRKTFHLWLDVVTRCLPQFGHFRFQRVSPVFEDITASLSSISSKCVNSDLQPLYQSLHASVNFYCSVFDRFQETNLMNELGPPDVLTLRQHILFLFAQPLSVMNFDTASRPYYSRVFYLLNFISEGLYTAYCKVLNDLRVCHGDHNTQIYFTVPAWFRILTYVLLEAERSDLENNWPLVLSPGNYINLLHELIVLLLDSAHEDDFLTARGARDIPPLTKEIYICIKSNAIGVLSRLCSISQPLTVSWWCPQRMQYIHLLKHISKQSISTEKLPDIISKAIQCIDQLVKNSSYSAQCQIFYELLLPKENEHHGLRGHLITLFKDSLHSCWVSVQKSGMEAALESEKCIGETSPQLPVQRNILTRFCEMIFGYPDVWCSDALVDQTSWLLAAVNMALYIFLRCDALKSKQEDPALTDDVVSALVRISDGSSKFSTHFLNPLLNDLNEECNRLQAMVYSLTSGIKTADDQQIKQMKASLAAKEATLLRLRLMQNASQRVFDCYERFRIAQ